MLRLWSLDLSLALVLSGVVYFVAFSWEALGRYQKFGLLELLLCGSFAGVLLRGLDRKVGQVLLVESGVRVGCLLAVVGQVYQTGADTCSLFLVWFVLISYWCLAGQSSRVALLFAERRCYRRADCPRAIAR